jgi:hypothetical protein
MRSWIEEHRPELYDEIGPMTMPEAAVVLNRETGLEFQGDDSVSEACAKWLAALKASGK